MILVDTSAWVEWSNRPDGPEAREIDVLLAHDEVATTDVVIAEFLQGMRTEEKFREYSTRLDALHYFPAARSSWLNAAMLSFQLRRRGLTTPLADLVIAQVAIENDLAVYATDTDFQRVGGLRLHKASS